MANIRWSMRSILKISSTQYSRLFVFFSSFISQKFKRFLFSNAVTCMRFLNRLPEYVLAIQLVQNRGILSCSCILFVALCALVGRFLSCSCIILSFERVAFQSDCIAGRMKTSAKMFLHLFTQTSESSRIYTQYRCHFRRDSSNVVGYLFCVLILTLSST